MKNMDAKRNIFGDKIGRGFSGFVLGLIFVVALAIFLSSNLVLSTNIITTRNVSVTEDVHVPDQYDYLEEINLTVHMIEINVSYLFDRENCTKGNYIAEVGTKCWYLDLINSTLKDLNVTLKEVNLTVSDINSTGSLTNKLLGNILASFGKNLYVISGNRDSIDENLTGQDGIVEIHEVTYVNSTGGFGNPPLTFSINNSRKFYFYLEQIPLDNLTIELVASNYTPNTGTANISVWVNDNQIFNNWTFDVTVGGMKISSNINTSYVNVGENSVNISTFDRNWSLDYVVIFTQSAALRFARATQYNVTNVYNYLTGTVYPYLQGMNANITLIYNDTDWLFNELNCSLDAAAPAHGNYSICGSLHTIMNYTDHLEANLTIVQSWLWSANESIIDHITGTNDTIYSRLDGINATLETIRNHTGNIKEMLNCTSSFNAVCDKLDNITHILTIVNSSLYNVSIMLTWVNDTVTEVNTTTHWIWDRWKRRNSEVINEENMTSFTLSSTANITIWYNITIPTKQGFDSTDYLPIRWKFWFLRWEADPANRYFNQTCINQNRQFKNVEPYCNPLVAQYIGRPTFNYTLNITLRPSLSIGNYTVVREVEIDPDHVWIAHARGPIGHIEVTVDTYDELEGRGVGSVLADKDTIYIDDEPKWDGKDYNSKLPTPTILTLQGERNVLHGSIKVEISDTFIPEKQIAWTRVYDDIIQNGEYDIPLVLNLVQGKEYQLETTICDGPTFDPMRYECEKSVTTFIA
jgi:hypothetical protein